MSKRLKITFEIPSPTMVRGVLSIVCCVCGSRHRWVSQASSERAGWAATKSGWKCTKCRYGHLAQATEHMVLDHQRYHVTTGGCDSADHTYVALPTWRLKRTGVER